MNTPNPKRPRVVLLVENDPVQRAPNVDALVSRGYAVETAASAAEALACARARWIHLAVIDARLNKDNDPLDNSGIELALDLREKLEVHPRIIYTSYEPEVAVQVIRQSRREGVPPNVRVHSKREIEIGDMVDDAFRLREDGGMGLVGINFAQTLKYDEFLWRLSLPGLLKQRPPDDDTAVAWAKELEDLFGKAFPHCNVLEIAQFEKDAGFVLLVTPERDGVPLAPFIVKCGSRKAILNEYQRYEKHVEEFYRSFVAQIEDEPVLTLHFGLLKYQIIGGNVRDTDTFAEFYRQNNTQQIQAAIEHLLRNAKEFWYRHAAPQPQPDSLLTFYQERLLMRSSDGGSDWPSRWAKLRQAVDVVIRSTRDMGAVTIEPCNGTLHWSFGAIQLDLPDPHQFLSEIDEGTRLAGLFPSEYQIRRCHGDLHAGNILVDTKANAWLIDFEHSGWGPPLQDPVELESSIHFGLIVERDLHRLLRLEQILAQQSRLNEAPKLPTDFDLQGPDDGNLRQAFEVIMTLRREASKIDIARLKDYFLGLIYQALRVIQSDRSPRHADAKRLPDHKIQALFLASACCKQLEDLDTPPQPPKIDLPGPTRIGV